jgi:acylphosphatase
MNPSMLENARLLGDRRLAEEALEWTLLSGKFILIYFMKTSFPMTRMIDHTFQKPAILKPPKLVSFPSLRLRHSLLGGRVFGLISNKSCDNSQIDMEKVRARVIIEGRVQGVFFRQHTQETAFRLGVKGWVKNRRDGCVEAVFEGNKEKVDQIIQWCHRGPSEARVKNVSVTWENYNDEFEDFYVTY